MGVLGWGGVIFSSLFVLGFFDWFCGSRGKGCEQVVMSFLAVYHG